jgi:hypothetical protein
MKKFPLMGFNVSDYSAIIYDQGVERFTGTTLEGIGQAVVGVFQSPEATANRFVTVQSIETCQNELLEALEHVSKRKWKVRKMTSRNLIEEGQREHKEGSSGWVLKLAVANLYDVEQGRGMVAQSRQDSDADLLGVKKESAYEVVEKLLN